MERESTCSVAALDAGLDFLGDDFASVALTPHGVAGESVYVTLKLSRGALDQRPHLARRARPGGDPKEEEWVLFMAEVAPERVVASTELVAIVFPEIADSRQSRVERVPAGRALLALLRCVLTVDVAGCRTATAECVSWWERCPRSGSRLGARRRSSPLR